MNTIKSQNAIQSPESNPPVANIKKDTYPIRALATLTAIVLVIGYVETMVLPGIPLMQKDLSTTTTIASWITSIVLLVGAVVSPLLGKFGDLYGKKRVIIVTLVFYTIGASIAGFSNSIGFLLFARALQGVGLAMVPLSFAILTDIFPKEKLGTAQGAIAGSAAISVALGLVLGSYIIQNFGWQFSFRSVAILSVILFVLVILTLKQDIIRIRRKIDYPGAFIFSLGIALVLLYMSEGSTLGWFSLEEIALLIPGFALVLLFFFVESKVSEPLISLKLLKIRNVLVANLVSMVGGGLVQFLLFFAVVYYAELPKPFGLGFDIFTTGLTLVPGTIVMFIIGPVAGKLLPKVGPKPILLSGAVLSIIGFLLFIVNRGSAFAVTIDVVVAFAGTVPLVVPVVNMISLSIPKESVSVGQGLNSCLKQVGSAIGPVLTTALLAAYTQPITQVINGKPVILGMVPSANAFNIIFAVGVVLAVLCIILSLAVKNGAFMSANLEGDIPS